MKLVITLMLLASALTWTILSITIGYPYGAYSNRSDAVRDFAALLTRIDELYIGEYEQADVANAAMRSAVDALNDEWSFYMTPEEYLHYLESSFNQYEGLGFFVEYDEETGFLRVAGLYRGSAAEAAGIAEGDLIMAIDGADATGFTSEDLRDALARPIGNIVELTVLRDGSTVLELLAVYSIVYFEPVEYEMLQGGIGYLSIMNFNERAAQSFIHAVDELAGLGAVAFIYDVRGNPGGWVKEVTEMLDYLLPAGDIFVAVDRSGHETITRSDPIYFDRPAVVLVDRFSFSAAEYFAAMLMEYDYARTVGEQTTGKSRMQKTVELPNGGALNISFSEYLTKNRVSLHDTGGITPDYQISLTDDELKLLYSGALEKEDDPQMQKALEILWKYYGIIVDK